MCLILLPFIAANIGKNFQYIKFNDVLDVEKGIKTK